MKSRVLVLTVCLLLVAACRGCWVPDRHVGRDVAVSELTGTWELTAASLEMLRADGYEPDPALIHRITFREDGVLDFASVHDGFDGPLYVAAAGTWTLEPRRSGDSAGSKNTVRIILDTPSPRAGVGLGVAEESGALRLWSFHDDPDLWKFVEYERVE